MTVINGKSYWAQVVAPSTKFDEGGVYSIDVSVDAENKKKAEALIRSQVIKEQQLAEQRKEAAIEGLRGDIGKAFRGASKGIII